MQSSGWRFTGHLSMPFDFRSGCFDTVQSAFVAFCIGLHLQGACSQWLHGCSILMHNEVVWAVGTHIFSRLWNLRGFTSRPVNLLQWFHWQGAFSIMVLNTLS